ncbi:MAG: hypothetical protein JKY54_18525 [Flavobacteriales bacterium]|nr:hypothetical protein [Flavobacteriales bacterium]
MGLFSRKKKDIAPPVAGEVVTDDVPMTWRVIPDGEGNLMELVQKEISSAKEKGETPYIFFGSSFADGAIMMRKFRKQMADAYVGKYIIELDAFSWPAEEVRAIGSTGVVPALHLVGDDNLASDQFIDGNAWEEDTLKNMKGPITSFLHG